MATVPRRVRDSLVEVRSVDYSPTSVQLRLFPRLFGRLFLSRPIRWFRKIPVYLNFKDIIKSLFSITWQRGVLKILQIRTKPETPNFKTLHEFVFIRPNNNSTIWHYQKKEIKIKLTSNIKYLSGETN